MLRFLPRLTFAGLVWVAAGYAQITPEPPPSAVVSSASTSTAANSGAENVPIEPGQPAESAIVADPLTMIPDLPPVPAGKATLVGGTIEKLDRVRDQITLSIFGGGRERILFDPRTRIYNGGKEASASDLREGQRIYIDTMLDGKMVFARSIRLRTAAAIAESQGVVVRYRADRGELTLRDTLSPRSLRVRVTSSTRLMSGEQTVPVSTIREGSLVAVQFTPEGSGREVAREIRILARPGVNYTFSGQVVHLDLRTGLVVLNSSTDHRTYEIYLRSSSAPDDNLHIGSNVTVIANLEDSRYVARDVTINP